MFFLHPILEFALREVTSKMPELGLMGCARAAIPTVGAFCAVSALVMEGPFDRRR